MGFALTGEDGRLFHKGIALVIFLLTPFLVFSNRLTLVILKNALWMRVEVTPVAEVNAFLSPMAREPIPGDIIWSSTRWNICLSSTRIFGGISVHILDHIWFVWATIVIGITPIWKRCRQNKIGYLISVRLWTFKDGGSLRARFLAKNQHTWRKKKSVDERCVIKNWAWFE